jgi:uncharacterized protein with HEPN domain
MAASKTPLIRMAHIRDEIHNLRNAFSDVTFQGFLESYVLRRTAEHAILIISEAVKALPSSETSLYPEVDWRAICDIGNVLRHEYFEIDPKVIWRIVQDRLPELSLVIDHMIARKR